MQRMQDQSGARIRAHFEDNVLEYAGTREQIDIAKALVAIHLVGLILPLGQCDGIDLLLAAREELDQA